MARSISIEFLKIYDYNGLAHGTMKTIGIWMFKKKLDLVFFRTFLIPCMTLLWSFWVVDPSLNRHTWLIWWTVEITFSNKLETYKTDQHHWWFIASKFANKIWKFQWDRGCYDNGIANIDEAWMQYEEPLVTPLPSQFRSCIDPIALV